VTVLFGTESYPTRQYESCAFPSGKYLSLRVCIGDAAGQNWWCVLFPSLCLSAASEGGSIGSSLATLGLSGDQYRIITDSQNATYHVRFKILEVFEELVG
jgi:stage II sporulation protein R